MQGIGWSKRALDRQRVTQKTANILRRGEWIGARH